MKTNGPQQFIKPYHELELAKVHCERSEKMKHKLIISKCGNIHSSSFHYRFYIDKIDYMTCSRFGKTYFDTSKWNDRSEKFKIRLQKYDHV